MESWRPETIIAATLDISIIIQWRDLTSRLCQKLLTPCSMLKHYIISPCHEIQANNYVSVNRTVETYCTSLLEMLAITNAPNFSQSEILKDGPGTDQHHLFTLQVLADPLSKGLSIISQRHRSYSPNQHGFVVTRVFSRETKGTLDKIESERQKNVLEQMKLCTWCCVMCACVQCACAQEGSRQPNPRSIAQLS